MGTTAPDLVQCYKAKSRLSLCPACLLERSIIELNRTKSNSIVQLSSAIEQNRTQTFCELDHEQSNKIELEKVRLSSMLYDIVRLPTKYCIGNRRYINLHTLRQKQLKGSEIDLQKNICEFDFVRLRSAIEHHRTINFNLVRLSSIEKKVRFRSS